MCSLTGITRLITSRNMRWRNVWQCRGEEKCILCLVGKPEGKSSFGRPGRRWKKTLKRSKALELSVKDWTYLSVDSDEWLAIMNARMKFWVPESTRNFWSDFIGFGSGLRWEKPTFLCLLTSKPMYSN